MRRWLPGLLLSLVTVLTACGEAGVPVSPKMSARQALTNPPEFLEAQRKRLEEERQAARRFPEHPQKDILMFLLTYAPLERWQHTVLEIIRDEAYYFAPQELVTKLWAFNIAVLPVFFSAVSTTRTRDAERTARLFDKLMRVTLALLFLPAMLLVCLAPDILRLWLRLSRLDHGRHAWPSNSDHYPDRQGPGPVTR